MGWFGTAKLLRKLGLRRGPERRIYLRPRSSGGLQMSESGGLEELGRHVRSRCLGNVDWRIGDVKYTLLGAHAFQNAVCMTFYAQDLRGPEWKEIAARLTAVDETGQSLRVLAVNLIAPTSKQGSAVVNIWFVHASPYGAVEVRVGEGRTVILPRIPPDDGSETS